MNSGIKKGFGKTPTVSIRPNGTIGYIAGSGGLVTQSGPKTTFVTLHKPCGVITMSNASLAAGATVPFVLFNKLIEHESDIVMVSVAGGGTLYSYTVRSEQPNAGGYVYVVLKNESVSPLSEAVRISFAIFKAGG